MAKFGTLPPRQKIAQPITTQYSLINVMVGKDQVPARPFEFAPIPNAPADGQQEYATKYSTSCPKCGHGIIIEVAEQPKPDTVLSSICSNCKAGAPEPKPAEPEEPFRNPLTDCAITLMELDPAQFAAGNLKPMPITVAERLGRKEVLKEHGALGIGEEQEIED